MISHQAFKWQAGRDGWQPRPAWAARYALATGDRAQKEFEHVRSYIDASETQARQERDASEAAAQRQHQLEQKRIEADKRAAEAQAEFERQRAAAEREKAEAAARERVLAERLARKSKRLSLVALVVACIAVVLAIWGFTQKKQAKARQLAAEATAYVTQAPEQSMSLAVEAYKTYQMGDTESVLR